MSGLFDGAVLIALERERQNTDPVFNLARAGALIATEIDRIQAQRSAPAVEPEEEDVDRTRSFAGDALRALEELRRITGVDEWDEGDWRSLAYSDAWELLGEDRSYEIMGEVDGAEYVPAEDVAEALNAFDKIAEQDLNHDLHAVVEHYRSALGCRA